MKNFLVGIGVTILVMLSGLLIGAKFGLIPGNADATPSYLERRIANMALDTWVERHATPAPNPFKADAATLTVGMKLYRVNCSGCHGDGTAQAGLGRFYPPVPQFIKHGPRDDDYLLMYIAQHGIRLTGMPSFEDTVKEDDLWKIVLFIKNIDKLPPPLAEAWTSPPAPQSPEVPAATAP